MQRFHVLRQAYDDEEESKKYNKKFCYDTFSEMHEKDKFKAPTAWPNNPTNSSSLTSRMVKAALNCEIENITPHAARNG